MNPDGSMQTNLTNNGASDTSPLWDPTGERFAFLSDRSGTQELYVTAEDGTNPVDISKGQAQEPAWSPDGSQLVFTSTRSGNPEIYKVDATGGLVLALTGIGLAGTGNADWSPDGQHIVFQAKALIYSMNSDGTDQAAISQNAIGGDSHPKWSPSGASIAFSRRLTYENFDIFVMGPNGASPLDITAAQTRTYENTAVWSPDGLHLSGEVADGNTGDPMFGTGVYVVDTNGSNFSEIEFPPSSHPCWSSDGSSLIYELDRSGSKQIYDVPRNGGAAVNLTNATGNNSQCSVRPK